MGHQDIDHNPSAANLIANGFYGSLVGGGSSLFVLMAEAIFGQSNSRDGRALAQHLVGAPIPRDKFERDWVATHAGPPSPKSLIFSFFAAPFVVGAGFSLIRNVVYRCWIKEEISLSVALANSFGSGLTLGLSGGIVPLLVMGGIELSGIPGVALVLSALPLAGALYAFGDGYLNVDRLAENYSAGT